MHSVINNFEAYLLTEKRVSPNTFASYKIDIEQLIRFLKKQSIELEHITLQHLKSFLQDLKKRGLSARSMARKISTIKVFFQWAHHNLDWENCAINLIFPKLEKRLPQHLTHQEVEQLFTVADENTSDIGFRNKVMLYLLYVTGVRISELTNLKLSDINANSGFITIEGKGGKTRMVPLPKHIFDMLNQYIQTVHRDFVHKRGETEYLFPVSYARAIKPISRQAFWSILKKICRKTSIARSISPHQLRHSLATHLLKNGADLRSLQLLLGHENLSTVQIYTHLETDYLRTVYDKKHPRS